MEFNFENEAEKLREKSIDKLKEILNRELTIEESNWVEDIICGGIKIGSIYTHNGVINSLRLSDKYKMNYDSFER